MAINRSPGKNVYIDWIGDTLSLVRDRDDPSKLLKAHFFVTTVGVSDYTFCEAFKDEKLPNYIQGITDALSFYGALPYILKPDNPKTTVIRNSRNELILNNMMSDLEHFYNVVIVPAPPRKPKGKPTVENSVGWLERTLLEDLKGKIFSSFDALNEFIDSKMEDLNRQPFSNAKGNRLEMFLEYDKPAMRPLPEDQFTAYQYKVCKVPNNYHIKIDDHYYSVPYTLYTHIVIVRTSLSQIIITDENNRLVAKHARSYDAFPKYITEKSHMPPNHEYYYIENKYTADTYRSWADSYGPNMKLYISRIIDSYDFEEQSYRSCNGLLHMVKDGPKALAESAASRCLQSNLIGFSYYKKIYNEMKNKHVTAASGEGNLPAHKNIRGKENFR